MEVLPGPVTNSSRRTPERASSSTTYCTTGLRPTGSISLGWLLVEGRSRVPCPATGTMARSIDMDGAAFREESGVGGDLGNSTTRQGLGKGEGGREPSSFFSPG